MFNLRFFLPLMPMLCASLLMTASGNADDHKTVPCFELRTYYANEGKLDALNERFRSHTTQLFIRHGMTNLGYWMPVENPERKLIYLLTYPSSDAREVAWKSFLSDPEWIAAKEASEVDGPLVAKIDSVLLTQTDFSPDMKLERVTHAFEMRTYSCTPGNLPALLNRFREHTVDLFSKHGMKHFGYFVPITGQPGAEDTLVYFLAHASKEAAAKSFAAFRTDPEWIKAKSASETAVGGSLTIPEGVKSEFLTATDYSPVK